MKEVFRKYSTIKRYNYDPDDIGDNYDLKYSLRSKFGFYFELRKLSSYVAMMNKLGIKLKDKKILDVGCHRGFELRFFSELRLNADNLYGVDIVPQFISDAKKVNPKINFQVADAENLPFDDNSFDIIMVNYVFCDGESKYYNKKLAESILRKLKNGGYLLFFDFYNSLWIRLIARWKKWPKRVSAIGSFNNKSINELFPGCKILRSKSFINVLSAKLVKKSPALSRFSDYVFPNEYYIAILRKN